MDAMQRRKAAEEQFSDELDMVDMRSHAIAYLKRGWHPIPLWWVRYPGECACHKGAACRSIGKHPIPNHGCKDACKTITDVDFWWTKRPRANVGIATGMDSGVVVVDIDPGHGGFESIKKITRRYGRIKKTPLVFTGSGGRHIYYASPNHKMKNIVGYMPGIDVRADGGLVVAPPSIHCCGNRYEFHEAGHPSQVGLAPTPDWLLEMAECDDVKRKYFSHQLATSPKRGAVDPRTLPGISNGTRNNTLISIVGRLLWESRDIDEIRTVVHQINDSKCSPPLDRGEVDRMIDLAYRRWG